MMEYLLRFIFGHDQQVEKCVKQSIKNVLAMFLH